MWIATSCRKFFKRWEYQTTFPASYKIYMQVKKKLLEPDLDNGLVPKWERGTYVKAVYCHPAYLTYMQSTLCEMPGWMKHKLESRCWKVYQWTQICRWLHPYGRKWWGTKGPLDEGEREQWKRWLKSQHSENEGHGLQSHHFMANRLWNNHRFAFPGLQKSLQMVAAAMKLKDACSLEKSYDKPSILKSRDITFLTKFHILKAMVFPVVMYRC